MDPRDWVDQLFTYGPYAVLALFILWVAPNQTKIFLDCPREHPRRQLFCLTVAAASWAVVLVMIGYISINWPPKVVYEGRFGTHDGVVEFLSVSDGFFVSQKEINGRLYWSYVIIEKTLYDENQDFQFTHQWGLGINEYKDYRISQVALKKTKINFESDPENSSILRYDHDNDINTPSEIYTLEANASTTLDNLNFIGARAYAQAPEQNAFLVEWLVSPNANLRAHARAQLRTMSSEAVQQLLNLPNLSDIARQQIEDELRRR